MATQNKFNDVDPVAAEEECALRSKAAEEFDKMQCGESFDTGLAHDHAKSLY